MTSKNVWVPQDADIARLGNEEDKLSMETQLTFWTKEQEIWKQWSETGGKADDIRRGAACFRKACNHLWWVAKYGYQFAESEEAKDKEGLEYNLSQFDLFVDFAAQPEVEVEATEDRSKVGSICSVVFNNEGYLKDTVKDLCYVRDRFNVSWQGSYILARKRCRVALELLKLMGEQVVDARNLAYREATEPILYPKQFKLDGKTEAQSQKDMRERAPKIRGWTKYYLDLPATE